MNLSQEDLQEMYRWLDELIVHERRIHNKVSKALLQARAEILSKLLVNNENYKCSAEHSFVA